MENFEDIQDFFVYIIDQSNDIEMAEAEFRRFLVDDADLRRRYREYCREEGTTERDGFVDFCEEYLSTQNEGWSDLKDYDEIE